MFKFARQLALGAGLFLLHVDWSSAVVYDSQLSGPACIATIAGTGLQTGTLYLNGALATSSLLDRPAGVDVDRLGNIYISTIGGTSHRVHRVIPSNLTMYVVAGTGSAAAGCPANGVAVATALKGVGGLTIDTNGEVFLAESSCNRIRKIASTGQIVTVAGGGLASADGTSPLNYVLTNPSGITFANRSTVMLIAAYNLNKVIKVDFAANVTTVFAGSSSGGFGGDGGPATSAKLNSPDGVYWDASRNEAWIADKASNRVRRVLANFTIQSFAGTGSTTTMGYGGQALAFNLFGPTGTLRLANGDTLIVDNAHQTIVTVDAKNIVSLLAGTGLPGPPVDGVYATNSPMNGPVRAAQDLSGAILFSDQSNNAVRVIDRRLCFTGGQFESTLRLVTANETALTAVISLLPFGAAPCLWNTTLPAAPRAQVLLNGYFTFGVGLGTGANMPVTYMCTSFELYADPVTRAPECQMLAQVTCTYPPLPLERQWSFVTNISSWGSYALRQLSVALPVKPTVVAGPPCLATVAGRDLAVGGYVASGIPATSTLLWEPRGVAVDGGGNVWIADTRNCLVRMVRPDGIIVDQVGEPGVCGFNGDGPASTSIQLNVPRDVCMANDTTLYITDSNNGLVRSLSPIGSLTAQAYLRTVAGNRSAAAAVAFTMSPSLKIAFMTPQSVHVGGTAVKTVFIGDANSTNSVVRMAPGLLPNDLIVLLGTAPGAAVNTADGIPPSLTSLSSVVQVYQHAATGAVYFAEGAAKRIRAILPNLTVSTVVGNGLLDWTGNNGTTGLNTATQPVGILFHDVYGLVWSDLYNSRIFQLTPQSGVQVLAGTGDAPNVSNLDPARVSPGRITSDASGAILFVETSMHRVRALDRRLCYANVSRPALKLISSTTTSALTVLSIYPLGLAPCMWSSESATPWAMQFAAAGYIVGIGRLSVPAPVVEKECASLSVTIDDSVAAPSCQMLALLNCTFSSSTDSLRSTARWGLIVQLDRSRAALYPSLGLVAAPLPLTYTPPILYLAHEPCVATVVSTSRLVSAGFGAWVIPTLAKPTGIAVSPTGRIFVLDSGTDNIYALEPYGQVTTIVNGTRQRANSAELTQPRTIAAGDNNTLFIGDRPHYTVHKLNLQLDVISRISGSAGAVSSVPVSGLGASSLATVLGNISSLYLAPSGTLLMVDISSRMIVGLKAQGGGNSDLVAGQYAGGLASDFVSAKIADIGVPGVVTSDLKSQAIFTEHSLGSIRKVLSDGTLVTVVASTTALGSTSTGYTLVLPNFTVPSALASDLVGGFYFVNNATAVWHVSADGKSLQRVAGSTQRFDAGDYGPAIDASFSAISGLHVDGSGALFATVHTVSGVRAIDKRLCYSQGHALNITLLNFGSGEAIASLSLFPMGSAPCLWDPRDETQSRLQQFAAAGYTVFIKREGGAGTSVACSQLSLDIDEADAAPRCQMLAQIACTFNTSTIDLLPYWQLVVQYPNMTAQSAETLTVSARLPLAYISPSSSSVSSPTSTRTSTRSVSPSHTPTRSSTRSPSASLSTSATPSASITLSGTSSSTRSATLTASTTSTGSPGVSISTTSAASLSSSRSNSPSRSASSSPVSTASTTATVSASACPSASAITTPTWTRTPTASPTGIASASETPGVSATPSNSQQGTASASNPGPSVPIFIPTATTPVTATSTPPASAAPSAATTGSVTSSSSQFGLPSTTSTETATSRPLASATASVSIVSLASVSPTPTRSPAIPTPGAPFVSSVSIDTRGSGIPGVLSLWDIDTPRIVQLAVQACELHDCTLHCSASDEIVTSTPIKSLNGVTGAATFEVTVRVQYNAIAHHFAGGPAGACGSVVCAIDGGVETAIDVFTFNTALPFFVDAVTVHSSGLVKSAWGRVQNITTVPQEMGDVVSVVSLVGSTPTFGQRFQLTVNAGANVTLILDHKRSQAGFLSGTRVYLGGTECAVHWISAHSAYLHFQIPPAASECGGTASDTSDDARTVACGYQPLRLVPPSLGNMSFARTCSESPAWTSHAVSCPPFCPNDYLDAIPRLVDGQLQPVSIAADGSMILGPIVQASPGVYVTVECVDPAFPSLDTSVCTNVSNPLSRQCPFGLGATCRRCPDNAICPGGLRAWPLPGYYAAGESTGTVLSCLDPATERCLGWSVDVGASVCGDGYIGNACGWCAPSYYSLLDGHCAVCPSNVSLWVLVRPYFYLLAGVLGVCLAAMVLAFCAAKAIGGTLNTSGGRMVGLASWTFTVMQVVASVSQSGAPGLPPVIASIYDVLNAFQFKGLALPSGCVSGYPFINETLILVLALACLLVRATLHAVKLERRPALAGLGRATSLALVVLYGPVANTGVEMLTCIDAGALGVGSAGTLVLRSNPTFECFTGPHSVTAALSAFALLTITAGYPVALCVWVHSQFPKLATNKLEPHTSAGMDGLQLGKVHPQLRATLGTTFRYTRWYFYHVDWLSLLLLAIVSHALYAPQTTHEASLKAGLQLVVLVGIVATFVTGKPYPHTDRWKAVVKIHAVAVTALAVALQLVTYLHAANPTPLTDTSVTVLGVAVVIAAISIFVSLIIGFLFAVITGARHDHIEQVAATKAQQHTETMSSSTRWGENPLIAAASPGGGTVRTARPSMRPAIGALVAPLGLATRVQRPSRVSLAPTQHASMRGMEVAQHRVAYTPLRNKSSKTITSRHTPVPAVAAERRGSTFRRVSIMNPLASLTPGGSSTSRRVSIMTPQASFIPSSTTSRRASIMTPRASLIPGGTSNTPTRQGPPLGEGGYTFSPTPIDTTTPITAKEVLAPGSSGSSAVKSPTASATGATMAQFGQYASAIPAGMRVRKVAVLNPLLAQA